MKDWKDIYKSRLTTHEEVVNSFKDGQYITTTSSNGNPSPIFYELLFDRIIKGDLRDFTIMDGVILKPHKYHKVENAKQLVGKVNWLTSYFTVVNIALSKAKIMDQTPMAGADAWWRTAHSADILYVSCTPPNANGFVSTGLTSFSTPDVLLEWKAMGKELGKDYRIVAEVNENMPWVFGDTMYHVSEFSDFIEYNSNLINLLRPEPTELEATIGGYIAEMINDGDTIQMGMGGISEAVLSNLKGARDLGVLSEVIPAGLENLVAEGIISNKYKPHYNGITVAGLCQGSNDLYEYMTENPKAILTRCKETNDIGFIASHPNMKAINMTAMMDLTGVSTAESNGHFEFSGSGGQLEFTVGAHYSPGGAAIHILPSTRTSSNGELISNIVPGLPEGTSVTIPRTMHDFVVTEFGVADLRTGSRRDRAKALIAVAHPDFRGELKKAMGKNYYPDGYQLD